MSTVIIKDFAFYEISLEFLFNFYIQFKNYDYFIITLNKNMIIFDSTDFKFQFSYKSEIFINNCFNETESIYINLKDFMEKINFNNYHYYLLFYKTKEGVKIEILPMDKIIFYNYLN